MNPSSDLSKLSRVENLDRIQSLDWAGLVFNRFASNNIWNVFRIGSEWSRMIREQISKLLRIARIEFQSETFDRVSFVVKRLHANPIQSKTSL